MYPSVSMDYVLRGVVVLACPSTGAWKSMGKFEDTGSAWEELGLKCSGSHVCKSVTSARGAGA